MERPWSITWIILISPICEWIQLSGTFICHVIESALSHRMNHIESFAANCILRLKHSRLIVSFKSLHNAIGNVIRKAFLGIQVRVCICFIRADL